MADRFGSYSVGLQDPAEDGEDATPSGGVDKVLTKTSRFIRVGVAGDVNVKFANGNTLLIPAMYAGEQIALRIIAVVFAGTSAGGIRAFN